MTLANAELACQSPACDAAFLQQAVDEALRDASLCLLAGVVLLVVIVAMRRRR